MKRLFCLFTTFYLPVFCAAQAPVYVFEHFGYEQGLSAAVLNFAKGKDGFLWLGSSDGLIRFDGKTFTTFRNSRTDSLTLPNNIINALHTDSKGNIWAATNGGLCYYDVSSDNFRRFHFDFSLEKIDRHRIYSVTESNEKEIWFATRTHYYRIGKDSKIISYSLPVNSENLIIKNLLFDSQNRLWIGTNNGMFVFNKKENSFLKNNLQTTFTRSSNLSVSCQALYKYKGDSMLAPTWYGGMQLLFIQNDSLFNVPYTDSLSSDSRKHIVE